MMGIAWSQVIMCVLGFGINAYYTKRYLNYGFFAQTLDFFPVLAARRGWLSVYGGCIGRCR